MRLRRVALFFAVLGALALASSEPAPNLSRSDAVGGLPQCPRRVCRQQPPSARRGLLSRSSYGP